MILFEGKENVSLYLSELELIDQETSVNYNKIQLFQHKSLGRVFTLDGEIQHIEAWTPLYHETIVHLPAAFIRKIERVLILGGGCFFTAMEILKYDSVKEVIMIDYDEKVIELIKRNYDHAKNVLKDKRFKLQIDDALNGIKKINGTFDFVINDSVDLLQYSKERKINAYKVFSNMINKGGICSDLIYRHIFEKKTMNRTLSNFKKDKIKTAFSLVTVPEYPGVLHLLSLWGYSQRINQKLSFPLNKIQQDWIRRKKIPCEYYNPSFLSFYLYLPSYLKRTRDDS